ncbi:MAG: plastocyanin/azurin family copper-binding protein [Haloarculaceae archaeon]
MRRRHLLRTGAAALLAGLAGCSGGDGADTPEPTPTETPATTPSPTPGDTPTTDGSGDTPDPATPTDSGGSPTATATASATPTATPAPDVAQVVEVAPDAQLAFGPETFEVAAGGTVRWTWAAGGHNVRAESVPAGSDWQGTPGGDDTTYDAGYSYEYTFDVPGEYESVCIPHENLGMTGSFTVTE